MQNTHNPFFRKIDWTAFWTATAIALCAYLATLAPTVTMEDSGELATAATFLGVPHPPGYPIWTIITWLFTRAFAFVTYRGQPNPAWSVALVSALFGALSAGLAALVTCKSISELLTSLRRRGIHLHPNTLHAFSWSAAIAAALTFAFSPTQWSQAVIVEVYTLNTFFLLLLVALAYAWIRNPIQPLAPLAALPLTLAAAGYLCILGLTGRQIARFPADFMEVGIHYALATTLLTLLVATLALAWRKHAQHRILYLAALVFGLGLTNHQVLLLLAVALLLAAFLRSPALLRDLILCAAPYALAFLLASKDLIPALTDPVSPAAYTYMLLNLAWLALAYRILPNGHAVAPATLSLQLGLWLYAFMPLAAETNPPMNWGYARIWTGFRRAITREQYDSMTLLALNPLAIRASASIYLRDLATVFSYPILTLGLIPFTLWQLRFANGKTYRPAKLAVTLALLTCLLAAAHETCSAFGIHSSSLYVAYRAIASLVAGLAVSGLAILLIEELINIPARFSPVPQARLNGTRLAIIRTELQPATRSLLLMLAFAFVALGFIVAAMAQPKGDIQDSFIQKVKFTGAHALYALALGYGLAICAAFIHSRRPQSRQLTPALALLILLTPAVPVLRNSFDTELIRRTGAADQHRSDFGWQFGNYALRGADAILEELSPNEEPLPNPGYPPPLATNAFFFGGTDHGRFVPTYMIYSARVRPDVLLVTQNALADDTYLAIMRDLYGDRVWLPSKFDSMVAMNRFATRHAAANPQNKGDLWLSEGRVHISGVKNVMALNSTIAKDIFDKNSNLDFYLEESYPMLWMYPHMIPHGLILQLHRTPMHLSTAVIHDDVEFWDWYARRLLARPAFQRDVAARRSFAKLRCSLAGNYAMRGLLDHAETAFRQAHLLYPLNPEACFRLIQEVLIPLRRFNEADQLLAEFAFSDPDNTAVYTVAGVLANSKAISERIIPLEQQGLTNSIPPDEVFNLVSLYYQAGQIPMFLTMVDTLLLSPLLSFDACASLARMLHEIGQIEIRDRALQKVRNSTPPDSQPQRLLDLASLYADTQQTPLLAAVLREYLHQNPSDWRGWLDLALVCIDTHNLPDATSAINQALQLGGAEATNLVSADERFIFFNHPAAPPP